MTSKERFITAMVNKKPDMVPVCPDLSQQMPLKMYGQPFWETYYYGNPPMWKVYLEALKYFKFDGRFIYGGVEFKTNSKVKKEKKIICKDENKMVVRTDYHTPKGSLYDEVSYFADSAKVTTSKLIKNIEQDIDKLEYFFPDTIGYDDSEYRQIYETVGDLGVVCLNPGACPGMHYWEIFFDSYEDLVYSESDHPELFETMQKWAEKKTMQELEYVMEIKPDLVYCGGSGMLTLSNLDKVRKYCLPTMKFTTARCKAAGIPTMCHVCGKSRDLVEIFANETDLNLMNPLEPPPMGDVDLAEVKKSLGGKIALSGNLHTTEVMLLGSPDVVRKASEKAIDAAAEGGGFILMTGDQCGRDTPYENIFAMVETARSYGKY